MKVYVVGFISPMKLPYHTQIHNIFIKSIDNETADRRKSKLGRHGHKT